MRFAYSDSAVAAFVLIPLLLVVALSWATYSAWLRSGESKAVAKWIAQLTGAAALSWLAQSWSLAESGIFRQWESVPPPFALFLATIFFLAWFIAFSSLGKRIAQFTPLWALIAIQGFRLPLELAMHEMSEQGIMPSVMSYSGRNFDILTGITALLVGAIVSTGFQPRWLIDTWNLLGLALLMNVVTVAILATPRFRAFGDQQLNVWVTYPPFVWLPGVMVLSAFAGHLLIFRAVRLQSQRYVKPSA